MASNEVNISGFMFIRDAIRLSYPVVPCIQSILPVVDEFVVNVGPDEDGTLDLVQSIDDPKIRIVRSSWNPHMNTGALVYAQQTNIAMFNCIGRWAIYMQADEIIHEDDHDLIRQNLSRYADDPRVDGIALREINFYGDGQTIVSKATRRRRFWIIKPHHFVLSRGDAAGFTVHPKYKEASRPLNVVDSEIRLFNYSAVVTPEQMRTKIERQQKRDWSDKSFNEENNDLYNRIAKLKDPALMVKKARESGL